MAASPNGAVPIAEALPDATDEQVAQVGELFPEVPCPLKPCGGYVVVQDRMVLEKRKSGLLLSHLSQEDQQRAQTIGRVVQVGPTAGWDELNNRHHPGWPWFEPGSFVKLSPHSTSRTKADHDAAAAGQVIFREVQYRDVWAVITSAREVLR